MPGPVWPGRGAPCIILLIICSLVLVPIPACSRSEPTVAAPSPGEPAPAGDEAATVARILALDPGDDAARAELAAIATGGAEPSVRLLALRRLDSAGAEATPHIVGVARIVLADADDATAHLRANVVAALARRQAASPDARAVLEAHLASARDPWKTAALAVVASVRGEGGVR